MNDGTGFNMKNAQEEAMKEAKPIYYALNQDQMNELSEKLINKIIISFTEMLDDYLNKYNIK